MATAVANAKETANEISNANETNANAAKRNSIMLMYVASEGRYSEKTLEMVFEKDHEWFLKMLSRVNRSDPLSQAKICARTVLFHLLRSDLQERITSISTHPTRIAMVTDAFFNNPTLFHVMELQNKEKQYKKSMGPLWCVNKQFADLQGPPKLHNVTIMILANTGFASMCRERIFVTI